jgi:uncharacterized membrane protein AbrB (regulator of aidB expression)
MFGEEYKLWSLFGMSLINYYKLFHYFYFFAICNSLQTLTIEPFETVLAFCIVLYGISIGLHFCIITFLKEFKLKA